MWNAKRRARIRSIGIGLLLFGLLYALVWLNKTYVRTAPNAGHVIGYLSGIFPNFIAAFIPQYGGVLSGLDGPCQIPAGDHVCQRRQWPFCCSPPKSVCPWVAPVKRTTHMTYSPLPVGSGLGDSDF